MSDRLEQNPSRVSFDPRDVNIERIDEVADERGQSRAELIREALRTTVEAADARDDQLPTDLREAEEAVRLVAVDGRCSVDQCESAVAQRLQINKSAARRVLKRLEKHGRLKPRWGTVLVPDRGECP